MFVYQKLCEVGLDTVSHEPLQSTRQVLVKRNSRLAVDVDFGEQVEAGFLLLAGKLLDLLVRTGFLVEDELVRWESENGEFG